LLAMVEAYFILHEFDEKVMREMLYCLWVRISEKIKKQGKVKVKVKTKLGRS
jgi:hypothetical protein